MDGVGGDSTDKHANTGTRPHSKLEINTTSCSSRYPAFDTLIDSEAYLLRHTLFTSYSDLFPFC